MMKENEYILCTDIAKIRAAKAVLKDLCPEINECVPNEQFYLLMQTLTEWEEAHTFCIKINEPDKSN